MKDLANNLSVRHKGFTLIELALVVLLTALLTAMAVPRYSNSANNYRVNLAARKVAADLGRARADAWGRGVHRTVTFSTPAALQYTLTSVADMNNSTVANTVVSLNTSPYNLTQLAASFGGGASVIFDGYGMPNNGGTVTVTSGTLSQTVTVNAATGNITIP